MMFLDMAFFRASRCFVLLVVLLAWSGSSNGEVFAPSNKGVVDMSIPKPSTTSFTGEARQFTTSGLPAIVATPSSTPPDDTSTSVIPTTMASSDRTFPGHATTSGKDITTSGDSTMTVTPNVTSPDTSSTATSPPLPASKASPGNETSPLANPSGSESADRKALQNLRWNVNFALVGIIVPSVVIVIFTVTLLAVFIKRRIESARGLDFLEDVSDLTLTSARRVPVHEFNFDKY